MSDVRILLGRLIDDLEHAQSIGLAVTCIDDVLPVIREVLDLYAREKFARLFPEPHPAQKPKGQTTDDAPIRDNPQSAQTDQG